MDNACWSRTFAQKIARALGYRLAGAAAGEGTIEWDAQAQMLLDEITQSFRYLPPEKIQLVIDYADFLRSDKAQACVRPAGPAGIAVNFCQARDLACFLKSRYGYDQPADERDFWTDEDRQDFTRQSLSRMEAYDDDSP
jgi:hypothetical protein